MKTKILLEEALHLKPVERLHLIENLIQSLNNPDENIDKIWAEESEKRYDALTKGKVKTLSLNEVKEKIKI
ncbi:MAG: addiction module protein [Candidatus Firestonebacteria bacterium]|nr:addiction module protein [Candidatus Firestonebacteria bacterium]